jgi:transcriptional regulator GlxA family with amidase domain
VKVHAERALVVSGEGHRLVMAGGSTSWQDVALYLIARFVGVDAAMHVAKINLIDWHAIGQQSFAALTRARQVEDAVIAKCQEWAALHYHEDAPVAAMAALSGLPERSFKRRFAKVTAVSPMGTRRGPRDRGGRCCGLAARIHTHAAARRGQAHAGDN